jgi:hypothetical protein
MNLVTTKQVQTDPASNLTTATGKKIRKRKTNYPMMTTEYLIIIFVCYNHKIS